MVLDTTIWKEEIGVSLLCEDMVGDFSAIKLLRVEEGGELKPLVWVQLRGGGGEKGERRKDTTSLLYFQDRIARSNKHTAPASWSPCRGSRW